jgi:hypothetical protein
MPAFLRELTLYLSLFVLLSLGMHFQSWLSQPLEHLSHLTQSPLGFWHPFYITLGIFLLIGLLRIIIYGIKKIFVR